MKKEKYILVNCNTFEPKHIFECGQCFRWNLQEDKSYIGVFEENVIIVKMEKGNIVFTGKCKDNIKEICNKYFNLDKDYKTIKERLSSIDTYMKESIEYGYGIRILKQDLWETILSFIISANNNIPRIKKIIEKICQKYGKEIEFHDKIYYTFPTPEELSKASIQDFRRLGLGFRDKRVFETVKLTLEGKINLQELQQEDNTIVLKNKLMEIPGVGPKVADCIMLFALQKFEVFPIDVWVRRVINELYIKNNDETKVSKKQIEELAKEKFGDLAGIAQQYLFYWKRES